MRTRGRRSGTALIAALTLALPLGPTACGEAGDSGSPEPAVKDVRELKVGFAQRTSDAPYYVAMRKEAERLAKKQGFKLLFQCGGGDPVQQIDQVQTMLSQGADVVIVNAISAGTEKAPMVAAAKRKPLLFIDTPIPGVGFTTVQSHNVAIGRKAGALMAKRIGRGRSVEVAVLNGGPTDVDVGPARRKGFLDGLKQGDVRYEITVEANAAYTQDQAVSRTEDILAAHPEIDVVFGYNDSMSLGALAVLRNRKNTHVLVTGIDGQKEALAEIKKGGCNGQYVSTGLNSPTLAARDAVQAALDVGTGRKPADGYPAIQYTKAAGIDCANVDDYYAPESTF